MTNEKSKLEISQEAREFAENIVDTIRESLIILNSDLRVVSANRSFYIAFQADKKATEGKLLYDLGNRQWDIPELHKLLEEILLQNTAFNDFEVEHDFQNIGRRIMLLNARRLRRKEGREGLILLAIEDVTDRVIAGRELKKRLHDLEIYHRATVNRELRMVELKKELARLKERIAELERRNNR